MRTQLVTIKLDKDLMTHFQMEVYAHEIPLYEAAHPDGAVKLISHGAAVTLDTADEYERLVKKFGDDSETGRPLVDEVYGHGGRSLEQGSFEVNPDLVPQQRAEQTPLDTPTPKTEAKPDINRLRELCDQIGIKTTRSMNGPTLQKMLDTKRAEYLEIMRQNDIEADDLDILELKGLVDDIQAEAA